MEILLQGECYSNIVTECCYKLFSIIISEYQVVDYVVIQVTRCMFAQIVTCMSYMHEFVCMSLHERYCYWYICYHFILLPF